MPRTNRLTYLILIGAFLILASARSASADAITLRYSGVARPAIRLTYSIPPGFVVVGVNASGSFRARFQGRPGTSYRVGVSIERIVVASRTVSASRRTARASYNYEFPSSAFNLFSDGVATVRLLSFKFADYSRNRGRLTITIAPAPVPAPVPVPVPEPATMILLGTGLAGIAANVRRHRKQ